MFFTKTGTAGTCGSLTVYHSPNVSRVTCDPSVFLKEKKNSCYYTHDTGKSLSSEKLNGLLTFKLRERRVNI